MWVEKRQNGKYRFSERYTDHLTGEIKRVTITLDKNNAKSRKVAQSMLNERIKEELNKSQIIDVTLKELIGLYRLDQKKSVKASTYERNHSACNKYLEMFGENTLVSRINANMIRSAFLSLGEPPGTLNERLLRLKALLRWGYKNDYLEDIRFLDKLERFKDIPHRQKIADKYLEAEELAKAIDAMTIERWKLMTEFMALSGLRIGEALALNNEDVDIDNSIIHVTKTQAVRNGAITPPKTQKSIRDVFMQDDLKSTCKKIKHYMRKQRILNGYGQVPFFFCDDKGNRCKYPSYNKHLKMASKKALGRTITTHVLRHTHASLLLENGVSIDAISNRLGHDDCRVTKEIYLHLTDKLKEQQRAEIEKVKIM